MRENEYTEFKKTTGELNEAMIFISSILNKHHRGKIYSLCNAEGIEIHYENDDTAFSIAFSREDSNKLPLTGQMNGKINDHISTLEQTMLTLLRDNPRLTYADLIMGTGKSQRTLSRMLDALKMKGLITRVGSNKTGYWQVK